MEKTITIIIADDHQMMLEGLCDALSKYNDLEIVGTAGDGRDALKLAHKEKPDVVVMDISMPGMNGIEASRRFSEELPEIKIIAVSMHSDRRMVAEVLRAGAVGFILKECAVKELAHAIHTVMRKNSKYLCSRLTNEFVDAYVLQEDGEKKPEVVVLSPREREVLQMLAEGSTTRHMADKMGVSSKTIETHRRHLMNKLNMHSVAELTKYALREGMTSLEY